MRPAGNCKRVLSRSFGSFISRPNRRARLPSPIAAKLRRNILQQLRLVTQALRSRHCCTRNPTEAERLPAARPWSARRRAVLPVQNRKRKRPLNLFRHRLDDLKVQGPLLFQQLHRNIAVGFKESVRKLLRFPQETIVPEHAVMRQRKAAGRPRMIVVVQIRLPASPYGWPMTAFTLSGKRRMRSRRFVCAARKAARPTGRCSRMRPHHSRLKPSCTVGRQSAASVSSRP